MSRYSGQVVSLRRNPQCLVLKQALRTSHYTATRGLMETDLTILDNGHVTRTTPELSPPFRTSPPRQWEDFKLRRIQRSSEALGLEFITRRPRVRDHNHQALNRGHLLARESKLLQNKWQHALY
ncbi:hypothetical protein TNCV_4248811 [Trichonephila clavipes]|nr:hypothetical protein TNCV_4248811 [Trichonephila clavipes]